MSRIAVRADFFDASKLIKVFTEEPGSMATREYWKARSTKYTTPFCFYEAVNVLKGKCRYKGQLSADQYFDAAFELSAWYGASSAQIEDLDFTEPVTIVETKALAQRSGLDQSDAFQTRLERCGISVVA